MPVCATATGSQFAGGDGTTANPYIVCNVNQFNRIGTENLVNQSFLLGSDINFNNQKMVTIGSSSLPYQGTFNGNGYSLLSINLTGKNYIAPFASIKNAFINNVTVNGINIADGSLRTAGLVAYAESSVLNNDHVMNLAMLAVNSSGGLVGELKNSVVDHCSAQGSLVTANGADGVGGLVGNAQQSQIRFSFTDVTITNQNTQLMGIDGVGGLIGFMTSSQAQDVYSFASINFSSATYVRSVEHVGGLIGAMVTNSLLLRAYVVGPVNAPIVQKGAAVGVFSFTENKAIPTGGVFWNQDVSLIQDSALGMGLPSATMGSVSFWTDSGFTTGWQLVEGHYPVFS